jgi:hypothetical protein
MSQLARLALSRVAGTAFMQLGVATIAGARSVANFRRLGGDWGPSRQYSFGHM